MIERSERWDRKPLWLDFICLDPGPEKLKFSSCFVTNWLDSKPVGILNYVMFVYLIDWLIHWSTDRPTGWLTDWHEDTRKDMTKYCGWITANHAQLQWNFESTTPGSSQIHSYIWLIIFFFSLTGKGCIQTVTSFMPIYWFPLQYHKQFSWLVWKKMKIR